MGCARQKFTPHVVPSSSYCSSANGMANSAVQWSVYFCTSASHEASQAKVKELSLLMRWSICVASVLMPKT